MAVGNVVGISVVLHVVVFCANVVDVNTMSVGVVDVSVVAMLGLSADVVVTSPDVVAVVSDVVVMPAGVTIPSAGVAAVSAEVVSLDAVESSVSVSSDIAGFLLDVMVSPDTISSLNALLDVVVIVVASLLVATVSFDVLDAVVISVESTLDVAGISPESELVSAGLFGIIGIWSGVFGKYVVDMVGQNVGTVSHPVLSILFTVDMESLSCK